MSQIVTIFVLVTILNLGCATGYRKEGYKGGFTDLKIQEGVYRVNFAGNSYTSEQRSEAFALLRASEIALKEGYKYFSIIEGGTKIKADYDVSSPTYYTYGQVDENGMYSASTVPIGGGVHSTDRPRTSLLIKCYKEKPKFDVLDAAQVSQNIKSQYNIK